MSQFYDNASLVVIPSGYKAGTVYAQKPLTTDGQLTFTRTGDTATRVGPDGLIQRVRTNLILQSQTFDNASWGKDTTTITANAEVAPDGTLTAETMTISTDASRVTQAPTIGAGSFTASVYVKIISQTTAGDIRFLGVVDGSVVNVNFTPTNQWVRYTATFTASTQITSFQLRGVTGGFVGTIAIWGFQLEASDFGATDYIPTTTAAVSVGPTANTARLDYLGSTCPRLILEGQRTNSILWSERIDNAGWIKNAGTITANNAVSPDGYTSADLFTADGTTTQHYIVQSQASAAKTISFFVKMGTQRYVQILTGGTTQAVANYDLQTGAVGGLEAASTASMVDYGNGWWRLILTSTDVLTSNVYLCYSNSLVQGRFPSTTSTGTIWIWGAMAENGATYATSYIPTLAASATRGADVCSKTGISSLINSQEGTFFVDMAAFSANTGTSLISLSDGSVTNNLYIGFTSTTNQIGMALYAAGVAQSSINSFSFDVTESNKIAVSYKVNEVKMYVNGTLIGTDTSATMPAAGTLSQLKSNFGQGSFSLYANVKQVIIFPTALTNAELAELTTL